MALRKALLKATTAAAAVIVKAEASIEAAKGANAAQVRIGRNSMEEEEKGKGKERGRNWMRMRVKRFRLHFRAEAVNWIRAAVEERRGRRIRPEGKEEDLL